MSRHLNISAGWAHLILFCFLGWTTSLGGIGNVTHRRVLAGTCDADAAFEGLCPWKFAGVPSRWDGGSGVALLSGVGSPRIALLSFSDRPALSTLTRPSLERFSASHFGRYRLLLESEPLLDTRDFHPAWNKLAYARRALVIGDFDTVVVMDDDVLITNFVQDPIHELINEMLRADDNKLVIASLDETNSDRVPLNTGVLIFKKGSSTLSLIDELFRIGRKLERIDGYIWLPRVTGLWDQDAFARYIQQHGSSQFVFVPHRILQSFIRRDKQLWQPGDFAAHFTGLMDLLPEERSALLRRYSTLFVGDG